MASSASGTITSANAILTLTLDGIFAAPQTLQGFAVDDVFGMEPLEAAETLMGVDGVLSGGFVFVPVILNIHLQADSPSNIVFDTWWANQQQSKDLFTAGGSITLPAIGRKYTMYKGFLKTFPPNAAARRTLQPRTYIIHWQSITLANF